MAATRGVARPDALGRAVADEVAAQLGWPPSAPPPALVPAAGALLAEVIEALAAGRPAGEVVLPPEIHLLAGEAVRAGNARRLPRELARAVHRAAGAAAFTDERVGGDPVEAAARSAWLVDHLGAVQDQLDVVVQAACRARATGALQRTALAVEVLAGGDGTDERAASQRLGYDLRRCHVGLLGWVPAGDADVIEYAVECVARGIGSSWLTARLEDGTVAGWAIPDEGDLRGFVEACRGVLEASGVRLALSGPRSGLAGFRSVHADVMRAGRAVRTMAATPAGPVWFADLRLEALLLAEADAARAFVEAELGELLDGHAGLLETLESVLDTGGDVAAAARRLSETEVAVAARMEPFIAELLGDPHIERRLETRVAVRLARAAYTAST